MRRKLLYVLLAGVILANLLPIIISAQPGGFTSWKSVNMTGVADSYVIIGMSGVSTSRFKVASSYAIVGAPASLTLTMISEHEVFISWEAGTNACNYMVRGAVGRVPEDRNDGYQVYYGSALNTTDWVDETETVYYRVFSQGCTEIWETTGIWDLIGGNPVVLIAILAFCGIISFIAMRSSFFGLKLMAGASWFGFFIYFQGNPPSIIEEGSGAHVALMVIAIGFGVMIVLSGLGRGIEQTRDRTGNFSVRSTGGFQFKLPKFLTNSGEEHKEQRRQQIDNYRERIHKALNPGEKK